MVDDLRYLDFGMQSIFFQVFEEYLPPKKYDAGEAIIYQGDPAECFYYVRSGAVRIFGEVDDGREKRLRIYEEGSIFGTVAFFLNSRHETGARAYEKSEIIAVNKNAFLLCLREHKELYREVLRAQAADVISLIHQNCTAVTQSAQALVAAFLLKALSHKRTLRQGDDYYYHGTQEEMASIVGISYVTLNRTLCFFKTMGILETGYRVIRIRDITRLRQIAEHGQPLAMADQTEDTNYQPDKIENAP